jgi:hypothetical protein
MKKSYEEPDEFKHSCMILFYMINSIFDCTNKYPLFTIFPYLSIVNERFVFNPLQYSF